MFTITFMLRDNESVTWYYDEESLRPSINYITYGLTQSRMISCTINGSIVASDQVLHVLYDE